MRRPAGLAVLLCVAASATAAEWRPLPWHLIDHTYRVPAAERFHSLDMDV